jgi:histidine ammonia-lyase
LSPLHLGESSFTPRAVSNVAHGRQALLLSSSKAFVSRLLDARAAVDARTKDGPPIYGVTTGFGASCKNTVGAAEAAHLVQNLYRYHGCGVGDSLSPVEGAAVLVCRLVQLAAGWSGIRVETLRALLALLEHGVIPRIPERGSVGASGDLTPMSYVAAVVSGEREAWYQGQILPAKEALSRAGLVPHQLGPKESLSIMNGTSVMTALACLGAVRARALCEATAVVTAFASAVLGTRADHFDERIYLAKPHPGSIHFAARVRSWLGVSPRPALAQNGVQAPYSVRCTPQVVGVLLDALGHADQVLATELHGAGDNPLVCADTGEVLHGGNFYGGHVAYVCDSLKVQVASVAEVCERQLVLLTSGRYQGLPENLVLAKVAPETHHGFKAMEILSSSLVAEALKNTMPATSFSRSTEAHNQDKVPMGTIASRDLRLNLELGETVLAISLLACAQAADARGGRASLPEPLRTVFGAVRELSPTLEEDRRMDQDIERVLVAYRDGRILLGES